MNFPTCLRLIYNPNNMLLHRYRAMCLGSFFLFAASALAQQPPPLPSAARILLLPRQIISGERATLAVLDVNGRLTPGVTVKFSNGDHYTTDATGRALFVAPLNHGPLYGTIAGRAGKIVTTVLPPPEDSATPIAVYTAPRIASIADRFEIFGRGFCGDADANQVSIGGQPAVVLAAAPTLLVVLPPLDIDPGPASVQVSCRNHAAPVFSFTLVSLELEADSSPLSPGEHRKLSVRARGTSAKLPLEARNLAPDVAELSGGTPVRISTQGGTDNVARFELVGRQRGSFLISIRLIPNTVRIKPAVAQ